MMQTVKVPLASNALYVSGTVNGVDKVWTREEGNWWSTQADRSDDGVYRVALSIIYGDGKTTSDKVDLYYGLMLITDRTESDVVNGTPKGFYNASDLNRVGAAMVYLRDKLNSNGYNIVGVNPKTDWRGDEQRSDIPNKLDMGLYLGCVGTLRGAISLPNGVPETPKTMENLTYITANDIEKILLAVDDAITRSIAFVFCSGDIYSGEVI